MEFRLVRTHELLNLSLVQDEVELRYGADLESLSSLLVFVGLDTEENDVFVSVSPCYPLINRLESHAGWAPGGPEVNHDTTVVMNDTFELCHRGYL